MKIFLAPIFLTLNLLALTSADFAYKSDISSIESQGLISFELPLDVYEKSTSTHLHDVAVFDTQGRQMPQNISVEQQLQRSVQHQSLPFKRFETLKQQRKDGLTLIYDNKTIALTDVIDINNTDYIIDASAMKDGIDYIKVLSDDAEYMVETDVVYSSDLKNWKVEARGDVLAKMKMQGSEVIKERIDLHIPKSNYLNIHTHSPLNIREIIAYKYQTEATPPVQTPLTFTKRQHKGEEIINFELPANLTLNTLRVSLPAQEQFYKFVILERNSLDQEWKHLATAEFYRLQNDKLRKESITLNSRAKYYAIQADQGYYLPDDIKLFFTYAHKRLSFMAQGTPPYTLYYGSSEAEVPNTNFGALTRASAQASLQKPQLINPDALKIKKKPRNNSAILVWISLIFGVMVLGFMSFKLLKETKQDETLK